MDSLLRRAHLGYRGVRAIPRPVLREGLVTMPSCSATNRTAEAGTAVGSSVRKVPSIRTVPHCTAHPYIVAGRRFARVRPRALVSRRKDCSTSPGYDSVANRP
ncbi:hypothetical protein ACVWZD_001003 [Streptomyces sp. TE3672]